MVCFNGCQHCSSYTYCLALQVGPIVESVRARGDEAVNEYTQQFDKAVLSHAPCRPIEEFAAPELDETTTAAFEQAYQNIKAFHEAQHSQPITVETMPGVRCSRISRPIGMEEWYHQGDVVHAGC